MIIEGKVSNQSPKLRFNSGNPQPICEKCRTLVDNPVHTSVMAPNFDKIWEDPKIFAIFHYIGNRPFIFETKGGRAIVYCSKYCMSKHNHRFNSKLAEVAERIAFRKSCNRFANRKDLGLTDE